MKIKELQFRPRTEAHDLEHKTRHLREFLSKGHQVRLVVKFRGREMAHPHLGQEVLDKIVAACTDIATAGKLSAMGNTMSRMLMPR